ncbi:hypothetical protein [Streptomyces sp. C10]|uniref:hypothetical protein n=1 Tax=Streptomyces sp. C10 TaxID=531941 RepID=UPI00397F75FF
MSWCKRLPWSDEDEDEDDGPPPWGRARESATVLAKGDSVDMLAVALASAPYGQQTAGLSFAVWTSPIR